MMRLLGQRIYYWLGGMLRAEAQVRFTVVEGCHVDHNRIAGHEAPVEYAL